MVPGDHANDHRFSLPVKLTFYKIGSQGSALLRHVFALRGPCATATKTTAAAVLDRVVNLSTVGYGPSRG